MKLVKSLLLGSAAGLAAVVSAQAADLPVKKAAPVEYVRVCSTYGAGFFYIPGTETCLRVGGRVRADFLYGEPVTRAEDAIGIRARGRLNIDARTATAYGLLRTYIRYEMTRSSGSPFGLAPGTGPGTSASLTQAFVQFGGLTAGRVTSFFSNADLPTGHMGTLRFDDAPEADLLAYTFSFGNGFSATLAIEDGLERRSGINNLFTADPGRYAGQRVPDVVANVKYVGTWGGAQLSGAVHQIRSNNLLPVLGGADFPDTEYGWALSATAHVNLPFLAPGDALWVAATYADGAPAYLNGGNAGTIIGPFAAFENGSPLLVDATIDPATGELERSRAWSVAGGLRHYWTPQIRSNFFGSYLDSDSRVSVRTPADFREYRLGANIFWQPVSGLDLGVEVIYANTDLRGISPVTGLGFRDSNGWEGRFRVQRDF
jgi:hypothetical protein